MQLFDGKSLRVLAPGFVFSLLVTLAPALSHAQVWQDTRTWDQAAEDEYSTWVETEYNEDFFTTGKYKGIATDCADAAYMARLIFAFERKLPFVINDPTSSGALISNKMKRWNGQSEMDRLRNFADYVSDMVSTKTIGFDTFPVKIERAWVRPGGVWSRVRRDEVSRSDRRSGTSDNLPGHALVIKRIDPTGVVWMLESTEPKAVRNLSLTSNLYFMPSNAETGLRYWLKPDQFGKPADQIPGYSLEQYTMGEEAATFSMGESGDSFSSGGGRTLKGWRAEVYGRLASGATESKNDTLARTVKNLCSAVRARVDAVNRALAYKAKVGRCLNAEEYDEHSTPSRDKRARDLLKEVVSLGSSWGWSTSSKIRKLREDLDACGPIQISADKTISLTDFALRMQDGMISPNPNDSLEGRWGETKDETGCATY
jgi:hypothetical protein